MTRGEVGTRNLNTILQQLINHRIRVEAGSFGYNFERVSHLIQQKNSYNRGDFSSEKFMASKHYPTV